MEENHRPDGHYELFQWRTLGCLIPAVIVLWLIIRFVNSDSP
jgi:hypothetical protein